MNIRAAFNPSWRRLVASLFLASPLLAQRMELADRTARAVVVETAAISTEICGRVAVTTFDLVFYNPNPRILEGTFSFPLLDGQTVVRFALDINGALREAVAVDKTRGRVVFEDIQRRRIDPGLLEQTAGNNYRARVFPIPAHGTRRIVLAYQEDLERTPAGATFRLALDFPDELKRFRLGLNASSTGRVAAKVRTTLNVSVPPWRQGHSLTIERTDFAARGMLEVELPPLERPAIITGTHELDEYFRAEAALPVRPRPRVPPRVVGLLWDASGSGQHRDHARELALLEAWFARTPDVEVRLIRLRDQAETPRTFTVIAGNWSELKRDLEKTIYDGATSLDGLADDPAVDEWLLFSDGVFNYGIASADKLKLRRPLHTILAAVQADSVGLRGLATRHGGEFVSLLHTPAAEAAARLRSHSVHVLRVDYDPFEVAEVFPLVGTPLDQSLVVTGRLNAERTNLRLRVGTGDDDAETVEMAIDARGNPSSLAAYAWATAKINQLSQNREANRLDIRRTSREFGIVTPDTSLIVLETAADYARYEIKPPADVRRDWATMWRTLVEGRKDRGEHLEHVVRLFEERVAWWEKTYPHDTPPPYHRFDHKAASAARASNGISFGSSAIGVAADGSEIVTLQPFVVSTERDIGSLAATSRQSAAPRYRSAPVPSSARTASPPAEPAGPIITLQRWSPNAGYLERLQQAPAARAYGIYLEERPRHLRQPGFFLDVANFFFDRNEPDLARRILSNLAEVELEEVALLRVLAHRLAQAERTDLALPLFERILRLRSDEPQSRRDLALACADLKQYQRAVDLLWEVVAQPWDPRFAGIELIALGELNALAATCGQPLNLSRVDRRLRRNLPVQTRVVLTWDTNDCDLDLWVTDPNAERASYNYQLTYQGGRMSRDLTAGYGPEEFLLRAPKSGAYHAFVHYAGESRQTALGPVTAQVRLITGFGTRQQEEKRLTIRLGDRNQALAVGSFEVKAPPETSAYLAR